MKVLDTSIAGELLRGGRAPSRASHNAGFSSFVTDRKRARKEVAGQTVLPTGSGSGSVKTELKGTFEDRGRISENKNQKSVFGGVNIQSLSSNKIKYGLDDNKKVVMQLVDPESNEIIRQIPAEVQVRIAKAIEKILEESAKKSEGSGNTGVDTVI